MNTDKEHLENLMAMADQAREAQKKFFESRDRRYINDARIKEDALDNLLKYLRSLGYKSNKIVSKTPEQGSIF